MLKITDMLCMPGSDNKPNEDYIFRTDNCIAVLDGATNLNGSSYGADEFVRDFCEKFEPIVKSLPLPTAILTAIKELYNIKIGDAPPAHDVALYSSAAAAFAAETETSLQILTLGDCTALIFTADGVKNVRSRQLEALDGSVTARLKSLHEKTGADVADILKTDEIQSILIENRKKMNTPGGYKSLAFNLTDLGDGDITAFDKRDVEKVILFSDGFKSMEAEIIAGVPFCEIYSKLREKENSDRRLNADPRFKISDDASIISFTIE